MKTTILLTLSFVVSCNATLSYTDTFGSGLNTFDIVFVDIGDPGNIADATAALRPAGRVDYPYRMGKYEISWDMVNKANILGGLGITQHRLEGNKPATRINWYEAAIFVNWLNSSIGSTPAYKFDDNGNFQLWAPGDIGYNPENLFRNSHAKYFLPSTDEWHKAAYYDPQKKIYYEYPTGSNTVPTFVSSGTTPGTAVFRGYPDPADITLAGGLSPFGTMGQAGNVWEWEETELDLLNDSVTSSRGVRGGNHTSGSLYFQASYREDFTIDPLLEHPSYGFRVASIIPEPTTATLATLALCLLTTRYRRTRWG